MRFLILGAGAIAAPLPNDIINGMVADAAPMMANIQSVVDDINNNIGNYTYNAPVTGFSIAMAVGVPVLLLNPAGTLATGTVTLSANPVDGMIARIVSTKIVTALTVAPNVTQSVVNAPTALAAGIGVSLIYREADLTWYRLS